MLLPADRQQMTGRWRWPEGQLLTVMRRVTRRQHAYHCTTELNSAVEHLPLRLLMSKLSLHHFQQMMTSPDPQPAYIIIIIVIITASFPPALEF